MLIAAAAIALFWLLQLLLALRIRRAVPVLSKIDTPPPPRWPRLSILVPARDEGRHIEGALRSKLCASYPELELVAIDDRSSDDTGAIIDRIAAADPRVRAVHVDALPDGWLGKLHAMKKGLEFATGDWVLFSDADVHVEPGALERLIAVAEAERLDFIAVFPEMRSVHPLIDAGVASLLRMLMLSGRVWSANDDRSRIGAGVGAFNLARRSVLESTRAIDELKMEVADDVALGALLKQSGARCRLYAGRSDVHLVYLDSLRSAIRSADKGGGMLRYSLLFAIALSVLPTALELGVPLAALASGSRAAVFGVLALLFGTLTHLVLCAHFRGPLAGAALWPIGQVIGAVLTLRSGLLAWRNQGIFWRDTFYSREALDAGRRIQLPSMKIIRSP